MNKVIRFIIFVAFYAGIVPQNARPNLTCYLHAFDMQIKNDHTYIGR